jgi:hypothetical protein
MKREAGKLEAIPSKRLFHSIIADYDLSRSICELVDNVLDLWSSRSLDEVLIDVDLDFDQRTIHVSDNGGGIDEDDLSVIVAPGQTNLDPASPSIGIFGVGSKRAVVALAEEVKITTRRTGNRKTFLIEFDDAWLNDPDDWILPYYEVDPINEGTTKIDLARLRIQLSKDEVDVVKAHLGATYGVFLADRHLGLMVNRTQIEPIAFEQWAYPPGFEPRDFEFELRTPEGDIVKVRAIAGLTTESHPSGEYGFYLYCNNRLVARDLHDSTVGYATGQIGLPHPGISLARLIMYLDGPARAMPWNSSKSGINANHAVFIALRDWIVRVLKEWASLSRRWSGEWQEQVFRFTSGSAVEETIPSFPETRRSYLPPLPIARPRYHDRVREANEEIVRTKPWTRGLVESIAAVELIFRQDRLQEKNRICLIILDSTLEIAFKEYLVHESDYEYSNAEIWNIFNKRYLVEREVKKYVQIREGAWRKVRFYYDLRNKLTHERATVGISSEQVEDYRALVEEFLSRLFGLQFEV